MKPSFTYAVCYYITANCLTPLRTGSAVGDPESILCNAQGQYIIQAASIAGIMRQWLKKQNDLELSNSIFGCQEHSGHLIISDGVFDNDTQTTLRPRLRIDDATGTGLKGHKFDVRHVCTGSRFTFSITWLGSSQQLGEMDVVEQILSAIHHGEITFGGQKSNGYGCVTLTVEKQCWDMLKEEDRNNWISGIRKAHPISLPEISRQQMVTFTVTAKAPRILVKSGSVGYSSRQKEDKTVSAGMIGNIMENGIPVIPGSTVKGAVISRANTIARHLHIPQEVLDTAFGRENAENDNGIPGQCRFFDVRLHNSAQPVTRIRIDRFTGGVMTGGIFCSNPITSELAIEIQVPVKQPAICGLILYSLRDLGLGLYTLGSSYAVGYGKLDVDKITAAIGGQTLTLHFDREQNLTLEDPQGLASQWQNELGGICHAK